MQTKVEPLAHPLEPDADAESAADGDDGDDLDGLHAHERLDVRAADALAAQAALVLHDLQRARRERQQRQERVGRPDRRRGERVRIRQLLHARCADGPLRREGHVKVEIGDRRALPRVDFVEEDGEQQRVEGRAERRGEADERALGEREDDEGRRDDAADDERDEGAVVERDAARRVVEEDLQEQVRQGKVRDEGAARRVDPQEQARDRAPDLGLPAAVPPGAGADDRLDVVRVDVAPKHDPQPAADAAERRDGRQAQHAEEHAGAGEVEGEREQHRRVQRGGEEVQADGEDGERGGLRRVRSELVPVPPQRAPVRQQAEERRGDARVVEPRCTRLGRGVSPVERRVVLRLAADRPPAIGQAELVIARVVVARLDLQLLWAEG